MKRHAPMRRTALSPAAAWPFPPREDRSAEFASHITPKVAPAVMAADLQARAPLVIDKENPLVCEPYRAYVRRLPCWMCHCEGFTQFAHADRLKGMALKSDDRAGAPLCGPHPAVGRPGFTEPGCHWLVGTSGRYTREERRDIEERAGADTQQRLRDWAATDTVLRRLLQRIGVMA
jgi:hypothetical protein